MELQGAHRHRARPGGLQTLLRRTQPGKLRNEEETARAVPGTRRSGSHADLLKEQSSAARFHRNRAMGAPRPWPTRFVREEFSGSRPSVAELELRAPVHWPGSPAVRAMADAPLRANPASSLDRARRCGTRRDTQKAISLTV